MIIRSLFIEEVKQASDLADLVYSKEFYESLTNYENKFLFFPFGFLGLFNSTSNSELKGYIIGHPWNGLEPVKLNTPVKLKGFPDIFYIHDVVISPDQGYRGKGYSKELMKALLDVGKSFGFSRFLGVAVNEKGKNLAEQFGFKSISEITYSGALSWKMIKVD